MVSTESGPLPVEFLDFSADLVAGGVKLNWSTASETNNERFEIERSENLENFEVIGVIDGALRTEGGSDVAVRRNDAGCPCSVGLVVTHAIAASEHIVVVGIDTGIFFTIRDNRGAVGRRNTHVITDLAITGTGRTSIDSSNHLAHCAVGVDRCTV